MSKIISFAGLDGSGKTTQAQLLKDELEQQGYKVFLCNPMHHPENLKKLKDASDAINVDYEEFFGSEIVGVLHLLDVWNCINEVMKNSTNYDYIIFERYLLDFYVYSRLLNSNLEFQKCLIEATQQPSVYIFLDVPVSVSKARVNERDEIRCRKSNYQSSSEARELFLKEINRYNHKIIDADGKSMDDVHNEIMIAIKNT